MRAARTRHVRTFDLSYNDYITISCQIHGEYHTFNLLVDTQADICVLKQSSIFGNPRLNTNDIINIRGITNDTLQSFGTLVVNLELSDEIISHEFHVVHDDFNIDCDGIMGKDFLSAYKCRIDYANMTFGVQTARHANVLKLTNSPNGETLTIPPRCEVIRQVKVNFDKPCVIDQLTLAPGVYTARTIVNPNDAFIRIINTTESAQKVSSRIEKFEPLEYFDCYQADDVHENDERTARLKQMISNNVPKQYSNNLLDLVGEFPDIFSLPDDKMSVNNFYTQKLRMSDDSPSYVKNYRTPHTSRAEIQSQVNRLIDNDLIEPCASAYNSPLILVPKKSVDNTRKWRMCLDYRSVNRKLIADKFPLPRIDDILDNLGRSTIFSVMDLYQGFHQVPLDEQSRDITAFSTESGSFRWKVLPFGLNVSPNSFSRMMNLAFSGMPAERLFVYIDDIIVLGKSEADHLNNLRCAFLRCRERNLKINPQKCQFFKTEVLFLGHLCTSNGILPDPTKYATIANYPRPQSADSVKRFVALANYYRKFIPNFSIITIPLNKLTKKNIPFVWQQEHENSFNTIRGILSNPGMLAYPDYSQQFVLTVDASKAGCGAVLSQRNLPIAFASKSFNRAEQNKATIEQELIAIHWAIKHFKHYLFGTHFLVQSDHRPLVYLYNLKEASAKLTRLRLELAEFTFTIEHIRGKENVVADALSRIHVDQIRSKANRDNDLEDLNVLVTTRSMTRKDELLKKGPAINDEVNELIEQNVMHAISSNDLKGIPIIHTQLASTRSPRQYIISAHHKYRSSQELFNFTVTFTNETLFAQQMFEKLQKLATELNIGKIKIFTDECIFKEVSITRFKELGNQSRELINLKIRLADPIRIVTCPIEQRKLIEKYHEDPLCGGHFGIQKMLRKLRMNYNWKSMQEQVQDLVSSCTKCQLNKPKIVTVEPLVLTDTPLKPFDKISIDTIGKLRTSRNGNNYALTMLCELSKYLIVVPIASKDANTVAKAIFTHLILVHGPIKILMSDQGTEFVNAILKEICKQLKIEFRTSTPYHHETMGAVERNHRFFNEYLRSYLTDDTDWEECLAYFAYCYNTSHHASFNYEYTPFELVYARKNNPIEYMQSNRVEPMYNIDNYAYESKYRLQVAAQAARRLIENSKIRSKIEYDKRINPIDLKIGDRVMERDMASHKHEPLFRGPFIVDRIEGSNVTIVDTTTNKSRIVHKNKINKIK